MIVVCSFHTQKSLFRLGYHVQISNFINYREKNLRCRFNNSYMNKNTCGIPPNNINRKISHILEAAPRLDSENTLHSSHICYYYMFILFYPNFRLRDLVFTWYFFTYILFFTQIVALYLLQPFQQRTFLAQLKKSARILSSSLSTVLQVPNNQLTSMLDESFNLC